MRWNSNADIGGVRTATLLLTIEPGRSVDYEAHILFHEIFHLYSKALHPTWMPNEMWRYSYPMEDLDNYRLLLLEEEALARAVESESKEAVAAWAAAALAIRSDRMTRLREEHRVFETLLELQEGTAVYMGRSTIGIANNTERLREERGPEGIRWRCYETGAAVAVVLDRLMPSWKKELDANPGTTFAELLNAAVAAAEVPAASFSDAELAEVAARAKTAIAKLATDRAALYQEFNRRGKKVIVRPAIDGERLDVRRIRSDGGGNPRSGRGAAGPPADRKPRARRGEIDEPPVRAAVPGGSDRAHEPGRRPPVPPGISAGNNRRLCRRTGG